MKKTRSKIKQKKPFIITDGQWRDLILTGQIGDNFQKEKLHITEKTFACISFNQQLYGVDLFQNVTQMDEKDFQQWSFKLKLNGIQHILITINSIGDKYKIAYYNNNKNLKSN